MRDSEREFDGVTRLCLLLMWIGAAVGAAFVGVVWLLVWSATQ